MPVPFARAESRSTVSAVVRHADGTSEDLGVISVNGRPVSAVRRIIAKIRKRLTDGNI